MHATSQIVGHRGSYARDALCSTTEWTGCCGPENRIREVFLAERAAGDPTRGPQAADGSRAYGIFSFGSPYRAAGSWVATGGVQTNKTKESLAEFHKELIGIAGEKPITEKELGEAKALRVRSYAQQFESLGTITGQIAGLWEVGLPMSELDREPAEFQRSTLEMANAVAKRYAQPDSASLLLVGDWAKTGDGVRQLDLGPIVLLDEEGRIKGK